MHPNQAASLLKISEELTSWLTQKALPVWSSAGIDASTGACFESLDLKSGAAASDTVRARVPPRQIYAFLEGANLGWDGAAADIAVSLWAWYERTFREDLEHYGNVTGPSGELADGTFDLYNQAFALFALAQIARFIPERADLAHEEAERLLTYIEAHFQHPRDGFFDTPEKSAPLKSNPHMHLFEACLAWEETSENSVWQDLADEIAELALVAFIDPVSGGLREFFDLDWSPMPDASGRIMEPGHQFEWAWLLVRWGTARQDADALIAARRLYDIGRTFGVDDTRGAVFMALSDDFTVLDPIARLWGQTEWLKAAIALAKVSSGPERTAYLDDIPDAAEAMLAFFKDVPAGLWHDKLKPDGTFADEPAPASSFYHIVCAISELQAFTKEL
ncbi:AGE family epimerase/isomerase [Roseibium denhamense]|nr:AGE family epimerase/isomerase [Roseibium denhamense]MTI08102.1 AGE family epimerase/isomerase [Roseibium denhamense]